MKKLLLAILILFFAVESSAYDKKSLVERFTNCSCGPCANLNNTWYNATTHSLINSGSMTHIVYNGDWPSPGECDPMHLLNQINNNARISYYGVNAVPWVDINGTVFATSSGSTAFINAINSGNSESSPFEITLTPERFSNDVIDVTVKIKRDPADVTIFGNVKLQVAITEKQVEVIGNSCCTNGETQFYSVCRTLIPSAHGTNLQVPAPGDSIELSLQFIPPQYFIDEVNFDSIRVVAFIQDDDTKEVFQSEMTDLQISDRVNAAFQVEENLGALPFTVTFQDYSTPTNSTSITSWEWDFNDDGIIDSNDPEPTWTFTDEQSYTVSLTVSDGITSHTRTLDNYITVLGSSSNVLVVNGIQYSTYGTEMEDFYNNSAAFGNHQVDIWDLFGDQGFNYSNNPNVQQVDLFNRAVPNSILELYQKVIWIGNNFQGDLAFFDPQQVLDYVSIGGNFLLATRMASKFFDTDLKSYCGITSFTGDLTASQLIALDPNLIDIPSLASHTYVNYPTLDVNSEAVPIFDDNTSTGYIGGFKINKTNEGVFIFIAGRPYRYDNTASASDYEYIIDNFMNSTLVNVDNNSELELVKEFNLAQNYPNPFNPATKIKYSIPNPGIVKLKVFDIMGREVQTLVNENHSPGNYEVEFNAEALSSGVYFYQLQSGKFIETRKMLLIK